MWLQPFLLLALEQWQSHGYELIRRMTAFGFEALDRGSVYRILRQLEKDGRQLGLGHLERARLAGSTH